MKYDLGGTSEAYGAFQDLQVLLGMTQLSKTNGTRQKAQVLLPLYLPSVRLGLDLELGSLLGLR